MEESAWVKKIEAVFLFSFFSFFVLFFVFVFEQIGPRKSNFQRVFFLKKKAQLKLNIHTFGFYLFSGVIGRKWQKVAEHGHQAEFQAFGKQSPVLQDAFAGFWAKVSQEGRKRKWKRWYKVSAPTDLSDVALCKSFRVSFLRRMWSSDSYQLSSNSHCPIGMLHWSSCVSVFTHRKLFLKVNKNHTACQTSHLLSHKYHRVQRAVVRKRLPGSVAEGRVEPFKHTNESIFRKGCWKRNKCTWSVRRQTHGVRVETLPQTLTRKYFFSVKGTSLFFSQTLQRQNSITDVSLDSFECLFFFCILLPLYLFTWLCICSLQATTQVKHLC